MDNITHPVPQNVTDFQFHLVGDMTLKQFGYLASGIGIAYVIYIFFSGAAPLLAYPLIFFFSGSGLALAFLPIQERPLDVWLGAFIKAIFHPTLLKYKYSYFTKDDPRFNDRLNIYLQTINQPPFSINNPKMVVPKNTNLPIPQSNLEKIPAPQPNPKTPPPPPAPPFLPSVPNPYPNQTPTPSNSGLSSTVFNANVGNPNFIPSSTQPTRPSPTATPKPDFPTPPKPAPPPAQSPNSLANLALDLPSTEEINRTVELAKKAQNLEAEIVENQHILNQIKLSSNQPGIDPKVFSNEFQKIVSNLQQLNEEAARISKQLDANQNKDTKPSIVKIIPPVRPAPAKTPTLTTTANIINGVITDVLGNYVEGAIIVAHDKQGLPVRALKSNKLGQFVAATPLPSGTYTMTIEKDDLAFDAIQVELIGQVMPPILLQARKPERML